MRTRPTFFLLLAGLVALPAFADHQPLGSIEPSADEQLGIYEINRARHDPAAYGAKAGIDLSAVEPRQPLAVNCNLSGSARFHAKVMLDHHEYGHVSDLFGIAANQMAVDNGYDLFGNGLQTPWGTANSIESILRSVNQVATTPVAVKTLIVDKDVPGAGHRVHLLGVGGFSNHREIGFGWAAGADAFPEFGLPKTLPTKLLAIHTGYRDFAQAFVTGVVFADRNGNLRYDKGEGIAGATVAIDGGASTTSMKNGGYALPVGAGERLVRCSGGAFAGEAVAYLSVGADNVEVDFHSGQALGEVAFAWQAGGIPPGPEISILADSYGGVAPVTVSFEGGGLQIDTYAWDFGDGSAADGAEVAHTFTEPGLRPVLLSGIDGRGAGAALHLVIASSADGAGAGTTPPADAALHVAKGLAKRKLSATGKDQAKWSGTLELPAGVAPAGLVVSGCLGGAVRTFTLDAKGRAKLPDGSKIVVKAAWPSDGSGVPAGTVAKVTLLVKGDLARALEATGVRNRTESRTVDDARCALLLGGLPYLAVTQMQVKSVAGKAAKGTLVRSD
mgnify:CR=1 FL=1